MSTPNAATMLVQNYVDANRAAGPRQKWEDLDIIYHKCQSGMLENLESHTKAIGKFRNLGLNTVRLTLLVNQYSADIEKLFGELNGIYVNHQGKKGSPSDDAEYISIIGLAEQYNVFHGRMVNTMMTFNISLTEAYAEFKAQEMAILNAQTQTAANPQETAVSEQPTQPAA